MASWFQMNAPQSNFTGPDPNAPPAFLLDPSQIPGYTPPPTAPAPAPTPQAPAPPPAAASGSSAPPNISSQQAALQYAIGTLHLQGQAAVDWVNSNYPQYAGIAYYPQSGNYGGNGWYAAPGSGQFGLDWIQRAGGSSSGTSGSFNSGYLGTQPVGSVGSFGSPGSLASLGGSGSLGQTYGQTFNAPTSYPGTFNAEARYGERYNAPAAELSALPSWAQPYQREFHLPTLDEARNTPGYKFALEQGLQGIDRQDAARGTLLTPQNFEARAQYATGLADQTYQQGVQNALSQFGTNYGVFQGNQANASNAYNQAANVGLNAYQTNANQFNQGFQNQLAAFWANIGQFNQNFNNALAQYGTNFGVWNTVGNNLFNRYYNLASLGLVQ